MARRERDVVYEKEPLQMMTLRVLHDETAVTPGLLVGFFPLRVAIEDMQG
jgi:hypothetical protein